jgi:hypothetical protein
LLAVAVACAAAPGPSARDVADANDTGRTVGAQSEGERALLGQLGGLPSGTPRRIGEVAVVAEPAYAAASGRTCRVVRVSTSREPKPRSRLACNNGSGWFFVPDVFGLESPSAE